MKIGIDLHTFNDFMQGSRTYTYNVAKNLVEQDAENEYHLYFANRAISTPPCLERPNVHKKVIFPNGRLLRLSLVFPLMLRLHDIDVFHCNYIGPPFMKTPYIVTLHDILHEEYPQFFPGKMRFLMSLLYPFSARHAAKVITVSEYSKKAIVRLYGVPDENVVVIPNGVADEFRPVTDTDRIVRVKQRYGIPVALKYILYVGRLEPRKNITGLLNAYHGLKKEHRVEHVLVIAGMKDFLYDNIFKTVQCLGLTEEVIFTGRVEQRDLATLYSGAELFVYPSFGEGFGIPPLEAMACGVPVITSNTTSLPEVIDDAGIMIDPWNDNELARAMLAVMENVNLQDELKEKGIKRARLFSWKNSAAKVLKVSRDVYESSRR